MNIRLWSLARGAIAVSAMVLGMAITLVAEAAGSPFAMLAPKTNCPAYQSPAVETHITRALEMADAGPWSGMIPALFIVPRISGLCAPHGVPAFHLSVALVTPTKAFDQLYFVGNHFVGSWALKTSAGLILFDTMDNSWEAQHIVVAGLRELGLNPASIKYIVVTHGHADHWGGARYLQETYHAHVLLSAIDWKLAYAPPRVKTFAGRPYPTPPKHDMNITDGEKLTLGATTITLYITPGHTPGADSEIIPVTDHGKPHVVVMFGGMGIPPYLRPDKCVPQEQGGILEYIASVRRLIRLGKAAGADAVISTHPIFEGTDVYSDEIEDNVMFERSPWVIGKRGYIHYFETQLQVAETVKAMEEEHPVPTRCM